MKKFILFAVFLMVISVPLFASQAAGLDGQDFLKQLDTVKDPFQDGLPKPVIIVPKPVYHPPVVIERPKPKPPKPKPRPRRRRPVIIRLPLLRLQGVIVGGGLNEAIINGQIIPLFGWIKGAQVESVTNQGVGLSYKGKKFFLKVD